MDASATTAWYGRFGGSYVAAPLVGVIRELSDAFASSIRDDCFQAELKDLLSTFGGRPTPLHPLRRFGRGTGAAILVKREDLAYTGGNYINSAAGQCLLARRMGARTVICETGSGHNGVATAAVAAALELRCIVFMGRTDHDAQAVMVSRMRALGAQVRPVDSGAAILSEAVSAAYQAWMAGTPETFYVSGAPVGPAPYPAIIREFQKIAGEELRFQTDASHARAPDAIVATLGGGSSVIGLFSAFAACKDTRLVVSQSTREPKSDCQLRLGQARLGVLHGARTLVLQDRSGSILVPSGLAPGLRYPATPPEIAQLWEEGRIESVAVDERDALATQSELARVDGLLASIESCHALHAARGVAAELQPDQIVVVSINAADDSEAFFSGTAYDAA